MNDEPKTHPEFAQVIRDDVGVMDPHVERDRPRVSKMTPGADDDPVTASNAYLDHEVQFAEKAGVDDCLCQAVRAIPSVILRRGEHGVGPRCCVDYLPASTDGDAEWLFARNVHPGL